MNLLSNNNVIIFFHLLITFIGSLFEEIGACCQCTRIDVEIRFVKSNGA